MTAAEIAKSIQREVEKHQEIHGSDETPFHFHFSVIDS